MATTLSTPPATFIPNTNTIISAIDIIIDWIKSVVDAARNPPVAV